VKLGTDKAVVNGPQHPRLVDLADLDAPGT
jgi:hypothetical protein